MLLVATGTLAKDDAVNILHGVVRHPDFRNGFDSFSDMSQAKYDLSYEDMIEIVKLAESLQEARGKSKWAFFAPQDLNYGTVRMLCGITQARELIIEAKAFRRRAEALTWLGITESDIAITESDITLN